MPVRRQALAAIITAAIAGCFTLNAVAGSLPAPIDAALSEAEANDKLRLSYTQTFIWPGHEPIIERYDASTDSWSLISGAPEKLNKLGKKKLKNWKRIESKPGELLYADYRGSFRNASLVEEDEEVYVFTFQAGAENNAELDEGVEKNVETRAIINKADGGMTYYAIKALEGFKPNAVSRLDEFVFEQTFERPAPDAPPVMTRVYWKAVGKQLLSKVNEEYTILYSDFEVLK